ncbi:hypothetical protein OQA88_293 [Cercophora sp. LCS_1]
MPALSPNPPQPAAGSAYSEQQLRFPPVTRDHILHCSYDQWFPRYRTSCIRSRVIPLTPEFVSYLREDGIILASQPTDDDTDSDWEPTNPSTTSFRPPEAQGPDSESDSGDEEAAPPKPPPDERFPALHDAIASAIADLGGAVAPKLNWSSPKDATWISRHPNTVKCTSPNDVYILLKSSSFISHDLDHAFNDTLPPSAPSNFTLVLVLRSFFNPLPSMEFRCFVKDRNLVGITQRDLLYYGFLHKLREPIIERVKELFGRMKSTFPDSCWVFDVYIPEADYQDDDDEEGKEKQVLGKARLIDINPWAPRTDTLLFGWSELLGIQVRKPLLGQAVAEEEGMSTTETEDSDDEDEVELRLVEHDDPAAYNFSSPQYSAHKMPKDVVDASMAGEGGLREFARRWRQMTEGRIQDMGDLER